MRNTELETKRKKEKGTENETDKTVRQTGRGKERKLDSRQKEREKRDKMEGRRKERIRKKMLIRLTASGLKKERNRSLFLEHSFHENA